MMSLRAINFSLSAMTKFLYNEIIAGPDRYSEHLRRTPAFSMNIFKKHYVIKSFYVGLYLARPVDLAYGILRMGDNDLLAHSDSPVKIRI